MNSKLDALTDAADRSLWIFLTADQQSDYIGARTLLHSVPPAEHLLADQRYDADWHRRAFKSEGIKSCILPRQGRNAPILHDKMLYRKLDKIDTGPSVSRTGGGLSHAMTDTRSSSNQHAP